MRDDRDRLADISTAIDRILSKRTQGRNIEAGQIWKVVEHDLQPLREQVQNILDSYGPDQ